FRPGTASGVADFLLGRGTRVVRHGYDHALREWKQNFGDLRDCFVAHDAKYDGERPLAVVLRYRRTQGPRSRGIGGDIKDGLGPAGGGHETLETPGPAGLAYSSLCGL